MMISSMRFAGHERIGVRPAAQGNRHPVAANHLTMRLLPGIVAR
jgi:hypothetical protein